MHSGRSHSHVCMFAHAHTHTRTHAHTHARARTRTHARTHTQAATNTAPVSVTLCKTPRPPPQTSEALDAIAAHIEAELPDPGKAWSAASWRQSNDWLLAMRRRQPCDLTGNICEVARLHAVVAQRSWAWSAVALWDVAQRMLAVRAEHAGQRAKCLLASAWSHHAQGLWRLAREQCILARECLLKRPPPYPRCRKGCGFEGTMPAVAQHAKACSFDAAAASREAEANAPAALEAAAAAAVRIDSEVPDQAVEVLLKTIGLAEKAQFGGVDGDISSQINYAAEAHSIKRYTHYRCIPTTSAHASREGLTRVRKLSAGGAHNQAALHGPCWCCGRCRRNAAVADGAHGRHNQAAARNGAGRAPCTCS